MNTKLHAVADATGRPIGFFMSAGQVSDYTGAAALLGSMPGPDARCITYAVSLTSAVTPEAVDRIGLSLAAQLDAVRCAFR